MDGNGANGHPPTINTPLITVYSSNVFGNLTVLTQGVQQRTFGYDGLGRLTTATTPEAGAVNYQYNAFNKASQRTDARGVVTTYSYDSLNRLNQVSYNVSGAPGVAATDTVTYSYDQGGAAAFAMGRLTSVADGVGSETYQYNQLGEITQFTKNIGGTNYVMPYGYNQAGQLKTVTYPSNHTVAQEYDSIGRTTRISMGGTDHISNVQYNPAGAPTQFDYGNGVRATIGYNNRLQLQSLAYAKGTTQLLNLAYGYTQGSGNNGQIVSITDSTGTQEAGRSVTYTYDAWARLKTAATTGSTQYPAWSLSWDYDRFGTRKAQNGADLMQLTISQNTNRVTLIGAVYTEYDAAGNMTKDDLRRYVYDAEGRLVKLRDLTNTTDLAEYRLDGAGIRVKKCTPNCTSPTSSTVYLFSGSQVIDEYDNGAAVGLPTREYIYAGSKLVAKMEGGSTTYQHADHLSARVTSDATGAKAGEQGTYPFGGSWYSTGALPKQKFTSYERDAESGNDYAMARSYMNRLGRFSAPDPIAGSITDPQSLNRYAYVRNDPVNGTDPSGLWNWFCDWSGCHPILASTDRDAGGGYPWYPQGGIIAWNYLYDPANGIGIIHDFASWWANTTFRGDMGDNWYNIPGNDDPIALAEAAYEGQVMEGWENIQNREAEERKTRDPEEWERQEKCANQLVPKLLEANGLGMVHLDRVILNPNYKIEFEFTLNPDTVIPRKSRFGSRPGLEIHWTQGTGDVDAVQMHGFFSAIGHFLFQIVPEKLLGRYEKPCDLLAASEKRRKK